MFGLKGNYRKMIYALISHFIQKHNTHVMLVPHVLGEAKHRESDVTACQKIFHETKAELQDHLHVIEDGYDHHDSRKFRGVYESVDVKDLVLDLREHDENTIVALSDSLYQRSSEFRARLEAKMPEVRSYILSLFARISK